MGALRPNADFCARFPGFRAGNLVFLKKGEENAYF
jgi:hypothetical protein